MTDFCVTPSALESAAEGIDGVAAGMADVGVSMGLPDPMMFGQLVAPVAMVLPTVIHMGAQAMIVGMSCVDRGIASNLRDTARDYREQEDWAERQCTAFEKGI